LSHDPFGFPRQQLGGNGIVNGTQTIQEGTGPQYSQIFALVLDSRIVSQVQTFEAYVKGTF
jgi:hypothetical protein